MPYANYYDVPSTPQMYRAVTAEIGDHPPAGLISHLVVHENDGLRHYGVWERRTDWEQYRDDVIRPGSGSSASASRDQRACPPRRASTRRHRHPDRLNRYVVRSA